MCVVCARACAGRCVGTQIWEAGAYAEAQICAQGLILKPRSASKGLWYLLVFVSSCKYLLVFVSSCKDVLVFGSIW